MYDLGSVDPDEALLIVPLWMTSDLRELPNGLAGQLFKDLLLCTASNGVLRFALDDMELPPEEDDSPAAEGIRTAAWAWRKLKSINLMIDDGDEDEDEEDEAE